MLNNGEIHKKVAKIGIFDETGSVFYKTHIVLKGQITQFWSLSTYLIYIIRQLNVSIFTQCNSLGQNLSISWWKSQTKFHGNEGSIVRLFPYPGFSSLTSFISHRKQRGRERCESRDFSLLNECIAGSAFFNMCVIWR